MIGQFAGRNLLGDLPDAPAQSQWDFVLRSADAAIWVTGGAKRMLGEKGYDDAFGARPLARVIQDNIKQPLAEEILFGRLKNGGTVRVLLDRENDKLAFEFIEADKPAAPPPSGGKKKPKEEV